MSATFLLLNAAYLVYAVSSLFRDVLYLRVVWLTGTLLFMTYGLIAGLWPAVYWNVPVLAIHVWRIRGLVQARRDVDLDDEADAIRTLLFPALDRIAFNALWHCGEERVVEDEVLIEQDEPVTHLMMILDGETDVCVDGTLVQRIGRYRFVGEISSLVGGNATATVSVPGRARLRSWDKDRLARVERSHPSIEASLLRAMGHDVARKLR